MSRAIDSLITYRILRLLVIPFDETEAFKLGIIDNKGKELKKMGQLNTVQERDAYTLLHRLVFRLKRIIEKIPIENKKLLSFAAALSLIKENYNNDKEPIDLEFQFTKRIKQDLNEEIILVEKFINNNYVKTFRQFNEELAGNAVGNNAIAGMGVGPEGEPGLSLKKRKEYINKNKKLAPAILLTRGNI
jgi:hypothetical protein